MTQPVLFGPRTAQRLLDLLDEREPQAEFTNVGARRAVTETFWVKFTSATQVDDRYGGKWYRHDADAGTFVEGDDAWIVRADGGPLKADTYYLAKLSGIADGRAVYVVESDNNAVWICNQSGDTLPEFAVVGLANPTTAPSDDLPEWKSRPSFNSDAPGIGAYFAITQQPLEPGEVGRAWLFGTAKCRVMLVEAGHGYADAEDGNYSTLVSHAGAGPAGILSADVPPATTLAGGIDDIVTTLTVADATGWPDPAVMGDFVITIDTEDLLVTAVDGEERTVTRGYNSTTPASHADAAAVTFKSGVVWADVEIVHGRRDDFIATINDDPGPAITLYSDRLLIEPGPIAGRIDFSLDFTSDANTADFTYPEVGTVNVESRGIIQIADPDNPSTPWQPWELFDPTFIAPFTLDFRLSSAATYNDIQIVPEYDGPTNTLTLTWFVPDASLTARGVVTTGEQRFNGEKCFFGTGPIEDYDSGHTYSLGDFAISLADGLIYRAQGTVSGIAPPDDGTNWAPIGLDGANTPIVINAPAGNYSTRVSTPAPALFAAGDIVLTENQWLAWYGTSAFITADTVSGILNISTTTASIELSLTTNAITFNGGGLGVPSGGTGATTLGSNQLLAGNGTGAVNSMANTRNVSGSLQLKLGTDQWLGFASGDY